MENFKVLVAEINFKSTLVTFFWDETKHLMKPRTDGNFKCFSGQLVSDQKPDQEKGKEIGLYRKSDEFICMIETWIL